MTWAKIAGKGIAVVENSSYEVTWNCDVQEENRALVDRIALGMTQRYGYKRIAVRAGGMCACMDLSRSRG